MGNEGGVGVTSSTEHWEAIYSTRSTTVVGWYQREPVVSLRLVTTNSTTTSSVVDVGSGASFLVDRLVALHYRDLTLVDVSSSALDVVRQRLGAATTDVAFVSSDVLEWRVTRHYDVWHDRAVFHFLTHDDDRRRYVQRASMAVLPGGVLIVGTFARGGPTHCSGLEVRQHDVDDVRNCFSESFVVQGHESEDHLTPSGTVQAFTWVVLRRAM